MNKPTSLPLTGAQFQVCAGDYSASITELGAGLREFRYRDRSAITEYGPDELPPGGAGQLLSPWPNRVDGGSYVFAGTRYQLDLSEPASGNAIHGLARWAGWQPAEHTADTVRLSHLLCGRPGYPFCLELTAEYQVSADAGLRVSITARNAGRRPAPYGTGSHPYLTAGTQAVDECELELPASAWLAADDRGIPRGQPQQVTGTAFDFRGGRAIGQTRLDHALTGLVTDASGRAWSRLAGRGRRVALWAGAGYRWLQVFTGDVLGPAQRRRALAIEPMTCPPNALATGTDLLVLEPGESVTHDWGITVEES